MALGSVARHLGRDPEVLIGMDTRESGPWLAGQVAGGLARRGVRTRFAGVITTPGVACLTRAGDFVAGVVISASHNPYQDNGLKVFGHSGYKLPDEEERAIEQEMFRLLAGGGEVEPAAVALREEPSLDQGYLECLLETLTTGLEGLRLVVDCGNGAAWQLAPELFRRAGARVETICAEPNGRNINLGCGALHVETLREAVLARGADAGVAFDGDADRAILIAPSGRIVDGDAVLLIAARSLHAAGQLAGETVVATVMSNFGLEAGLAAEGIRLLRTPVGDKYVLEEMLRVGAVLGGEQSGHVIFSRHATTGDGLLTALRVFEISCNQRATIDDLIFGFKVFPQKLLNVRVSRRMPLEQLPRVQAAMREGERELNGAGRILVRFSGTEPLARVMVEGPDGDLVERLTERIAGAIRSEIGG